LPHWFIFGVAHALTAQTVLFDEFTDGSATDGVPVTWTVHENAQGSYSVIDGDYVAMGDNPNVGSQVMSSNVRNAIFQDVSVQTQASVTGSVAELAFFPDGQTLAVGFQDRMVELWHVDRDKEQFNIDEGLEEHSSLKRMKR
jgi:hypothetical protein